MIRVILYISGKVQRVNYRSKVISIAEKYNIKGNIQNLSNSNVKVIAEGEEKDIDRFIHEINIKNTLINVTGIKKEYSTPTGEYESFYKLVSEGETDERLDTAADLLKELINVTRNGFSGLEKKQDIMIEKQDEHIGITREILHKQDEHIGITREILHKQDEHIGITREILHKQDEHISITREILHKQDEHISITREILHKQDEHIGISREILNKQDEHIGISREILNKQDEHMALTKEGFNNMLSKQEKHINVTKEGFNSVTQELKSFKDVHQEILELRQEITELRGTVSRIERMVEA